MFTVNAWLERSHPKVELCESLTNRKIFSIEGERLEDLVHSGEISLADFENPEETHNLIRELFLISLKNFTASSKQVEPEQASIIFFPILNTLARKQSYFYKKAEVIAIC